MYFGKYYMIQITVHKRFEHLFYIPNPFLHPPKLMLVVELWPDRRIRGNDISNNFYLPICLHILNFRAKPAGLDF